MAANGNARSAGGPCPLNYFCACFAGNVSHPAKVRDDDISLILDRFRLANNLVAGKLASGNGHEGTSLSQRKE